MSGILESLNQSSAAALAAVVNSLWQAVAVAAAAWLVMRFTPRMNAATRHILWWAVLAMVVVLPVAPVLVRAVSPQAASTVEPLRSQSQALAEDPVALPPMEARVAADPPQAPLEIRAGAWPSWILAASTAVLLVQLGRVAWSYLYLRRVQRRAHPASRELRANFDAWMMSCRVYRPARLLVSSEIRSPMAVGFRHPAVILPEPLLGEFQESELDHVLLHELAHIARRDDWTNLAARLAAGILALHPVAAWALGRIGREREIACDDWVVAMTGAARPYAASLARLFELCSARRPMLLASGMAESASHLGKRVEMLLRRSREFAPRASATRIVLGTAVLAALVIAGAQVPSWFAFAQDQAPPAPPAAAQPPAAAVPPEAPQPPAAALPRNLPAPPAPARPPIAAQPPAIPEESLSGYRGKLLNDLRRQMADLSSSLTPSHPKIRRLQAQIDAIQAELMAQAAPPPAAPAPPAPDRNSFLAALVAAGYGNLSVDQIIDLKTAGVSAEFLRGINEAGWGKLSPTELIELAHHGVNPDYLRKMKAAGLKDLTLKDVTELSMVGARPEYIQEIHSFGFGPYTTKQFIQFAQVGLRPEMFRALKEAGFGNAAPNEIIEAAMTGVGPRDLREAKQYGSSLTLKQIVKLKMAGVL
ncbi:Peptidase M56, BlaR1 [Candidatus Sulfopaludibacter sp. SbA4]|nr:Peptidase M56, BlaR1 [Candidatus Sulfopaludibacter sp. SbA4]